MKKSLLLVFVALMSVFSANAATIDVTFNQNITWDNYVSSQGWWQIWTAKLDSNNNGISISNTSTTVAKMWGSYTNTTLDHQFTFLYYYGEKVPYNTVTATLSQDGDKVICVADFVTSTDTYHVTVIYDPNAPVDKSIQYDTDSDCEQIFSLDDVADLDFDSEYEDVMLKADNGEAIFLTDITFQNPDADIVVPAGKYPVADQYYYNTIIASTGYWADYQVFLPTYVATYEDGYYQDFWFIVEGELNVEKIKMEDGSVKMYMELTGKNSYDRNVHVVIGDRITTGISNAQVVEKKTVKVVRDGKINILNGMRKYDAAGKTLK